MPLLPQVRAAVPARVVREAEPGPQHDVAQELPGQRLGGVDEVAQRIGVAQRHGAREGEQPLRRLGLDRLGECAFAAEVEVQPPLLTAARALIAVIDASAYPAPWKTSAAEWISSWRVNWARYCWAMGTP